VLVYWDLWAGDIFLCPASFLWVRVNVLLVPPAVSVFWWFAVCFSILWGSLTLGAAHWLRRWSLWSATYPASGNGLLPACSQPSCLSRVCLLVVHAEISSLSLPLLQCTFSFPAPSAVVVDYNSLFIVQFFWVGGVSLPRECAGLSWGWLREFHMMCGAYLFGL
jgi:hypothetical protein